MKCCWHWRPFPACLPRDLFHRIPRARGELAAERLLDQRHAYCAAGARDIGHEDLGALHAGFERRPSRWAETASTRFRLLIEGDRRVLTAPSTRGATRVPRAYLRELLISTETSRLRLATALTISASAAKSRTSLP